MKNFHKDRRLLAYAADIWRERDLSVDKAVERILLMLDLVNLVRASTDRTPVSRNRMRRALNLTTDELDALLDPLLPVEQQRNPAAQPVSYRVIRRVHSLPGAKGRPAERYEIIGQRGQAGVPRTTWDGMVLDAGYRESLQWDIAVEVWKPRWVKEADLVKLFRNYPTPDGDGIYGVEGVRAHIEEMIEWNRLQRASAKRARAILGARHGTGAIPGLIMKGSAPLNPKGRSRAKRWDAVEFMRTLAIKRAVGDGRMLQSEASRNAPMRSDPGTWEEPTDEALLENVPRRGENAPQEPETLLPEPEPVVEADEVLAESEASDDEILVEPEEIATEADDWPADEVVAEDIVSGESTLASAASRNRELREEG